MPQAATVRVPAADRAHPLKEVLRARLGMCAISSQCLTARD
jgi:hypothetical protein